MLRIRCSVVLATALVVAGLVLVPAPSAAWSGWGGDLSFDSLIAAWSQWFGTPASGTVVSKGSVILDPDGNPVDSEGNKPADDPPAANSVQVDPPEIGDSVGD